MEATHLCIEYMMYATHVGPRRRTDNIRPAAFTLYNIPGTQFWQGSISKPWQDSGIGFTECDPGDRSHTRLA